MVLNRERLSGWPALIAIVASVWLAWQIVVQPVAQRLPPEMALRVMPNSPEVMARAAESAWLAKNADAALVRARESIGRAPFSVRGVRVLGMVVEASGDLDTGSQLVTLAGNWSLRDDPAHAWLMNYDLQRGAYHSSFAHADTLLRRRGDLQTALFPILTEGAANDPRALSALVARLDASPPWRRSYTSGLHSSATGRVLAANLAMSLKDRAAPFSDEELTELYYNLDLNGEVAALKQISRYMSDGRGPLVAGGDFKEVRKLGPLGWTLRPAAGITGEVLQADRDGKPGAVLNATHNGVARGGVIDQTLLLDSGTFRFSGRAFLERADAEPRLEWTLTCVDGNRFVAKFRPDPSLPDQWASFGGTFTVPAGCPRQLLALSAPGGDRRRTTNYWFDDIRVDPLRP